MVCTCTSSSSTSTIEKLQYGPLYTQYKSGDLSLARSYSRERSLIPQYQQECCAYVKPDYTVGDHWHACALFMGVWLAYTGVLYTIFFLLRNRQPIKIRDIRVVSVFVASLVVQSVYLNISLMSSGTHNKYDSAIGTFAFILYLYFHLMRAVRLLFIYKWHEAKAYSAKYREWFMNFRFVLEFRFYIGAAVVLFVLVILPIMLVLYKESPVFTQSGDAVYTTVRCNWWHIPEEYTKNTTNSAMCPCIRAIFLKEGETTSCTSGFVHTCYNPYYMQSSLEATFCSVCKAAPTSTACEDAYVDFYASGACGFPSRTPDFNTCAGGLFGDRYLGYTFVSVCYFLLAMNFLFLAPILFKRDFFGLVVENLLTIANTGPVLTLIFLDDSFKSQLGSWWPSKNYSVAFLVGNISSFITTSIVLGYPIALYYLYWYKTLPSSSGSVDLKSRSKNNKNSFENTKSNKPSSSEAPPSPTALRSDTLIFETKDAHEIAVQQCIASSTLRPVYLKFAVDEFTTEHVVFIHRCQELFQNIRDMAPQQLLVEVQDIYDHFIRSGSQMEVNISATTRTSVTSAVEALEAEVPSTVTGTNPMKGRSSVHLTRSAQDKTLESIKAAYKTIVILMARSSWPRFISCRYFAEYESLQSRELKVELNVKKWLSQPVIAASASFDDTPPIESEFGQSSSIV